MGNIAFGLVKGRFLYRVGSFAADIYCHAGKYFMSKVTHILSRKYCSCKANVARS